MRLMMAMAGARHGGAEAFFERLAAAMARRNVDLLAAIRTDKERAARLNADGITTIELPFGGALDFTSRRRLSRAAAGFSPQIILSFMSRAAKFAPGGVPGERLHIGRLGGYYSTKYYRSCDHLIVNTKGIRRYLTESGLEPSRVHHLPNFVDETPVPPRPRSDLGTPADAPLIVALGRLHRNKAFDILLQALAQMRDAHLWLAGAGELSSDLRSQASSLGIEDRVRFLGWVDAPAPLLEAADIVCVPSRHEPLGNVVLEAWMRGKPVVAAASEGPSELVREGQNGLLVPVDDAVALAAALQRVRDDANLAGHLADGGYATWQKSFSEKAVVDAYLALFERLCDQAGIGRTNP